MHSAPIRAYLLLDDGTMTTLEKSWKRFCRCYWALSGIPPHSILAPVEALTTLILEWPQLGWGDSARRWGDIAMSPHRSRDSGSTSAPQDNCLRRRHNTRVAGCPNSAEVQHFFAALMGKCGHQLGHHSMSSIVPGRGASFGLSE